MIVNDEICNSDGSSQPIFFKQTDTHFSAIINLNITLLTCNLKTYLVIYSTKSCALMRFPISFVYSCLSKSIYEQRKWIYLSFGHLKKMMEKKTNYMWDLMRFVQWKRLFVLLEFSVHCGNRRITISLWARKENDSFLYVPCACVWLSWHERMSERIKLNDNVSIVVYAKCNMILKNSE